MTGSAAAPLSLEGRRIEALLVDLDGTLTDPFDGITRSLREAAAAIGRPVPASDDLAWAIGPPLFENIRRVAPDADEATVWAGVAAYRARYGAVGKFENAVYPGIPAALAALNAAGLTLHLATSKLETHAIEILEHFGLAGFFASAYGSQLDGARGNKAELIAHILSDRGLSAGRLAMVGDRKHDCLGAAAHGIPTIGVAWGYGGRAELTSAGAAAIVATPEEWVTVATAAAGL